MVRLGFSVREEDILTPALAMAAIIRQHGLRPHLLVHPGVLGDLGVLEDQEDQVEPNCVVVGDAGQGFNFDSLNRCWELSFFPPIPSPEKTSLPPRAFRVLASLPSAALYCLGRGKFYREAGQLDLDVGAFTAALEFAGSRQIK